MNRSRRSSGFTLIELLIVVVIVGILALAAIPLITNNARDARRAEGEQMMGSMKSQVRTTYARTGNSGNITQLSGPVFPTGTGCNVTPTELNGKYFTMQDGVLTTALDFTLTTDANNGTDGTGTLVATWSGGDGNFSWPP